MGTPFPRIPLLLGRQSSSIPATTWILTASLYTLDLSRSWTLSLFRPYTLHLRFIPTTLLLKRTILSIKLTVSYAFVVGILLGECVSKIDSSSIYILTKADPGVPCLRFRCLPEASGLACQMRNPYSPLR